MKSRKSFFSSPGLEDYCLELLPYEYFFKYFRGLPQSDLVKVLGFLVASFTPWKLEEVIVKFFFVPFPNEQ